LVPAAAAAGADLGAAAAASGAVAAVLPAGSAALGAGGVGRGQAPAHALPVGTPVVVRGLMKAPEHNGKAGRVASFDPQRARYEVQLVDGVVLSLRPQNLAQRCEVEISGLQSRPGLNGATGQIVSYDDATGRYMVLVGDSQAAMALQRKNCVLPAGMRVCLCDLTNERYNGQMARIAGVDREAGRYSVECQNGDVIKVKLAKVIC